MKFSEKLKKLRVENNLTQDDLADKIFVTRTAVSKWETDNGYPSIESLKFLAKLFGTTVDELISDEDIQRKANLEERNSKINHIIALIGIAIAVALSVGMIFIKNDVVKTLFVALGIAGAAIYLTFTELSLVIYRDKFLTKKQRIYFKAREIFGALLLCLVLSIAVAVK